MCGVFTTEADDLRHQLGTNMFQTDETNPGDSEPVMQLGFESGRKITPHDLRVNAKVSEDAPADNSLDGG
jgi:hypothetical protein